MSLQILISPLHCQINARFYKDEVFINLNMDDALVRSKFEADRKLPYSFNYLVSYNNALHPKYTRWL